MLFERVSGQKSDFGRLINTMLYRFANRLLLFKCYDNKMVKFLFREIFMWLTNKKKKCFSVSIGSRPALSCQPPLKSSLKHCFFHTFLNSFSWFQPKNHWRTFEMNKNGPNGQKEVFQPAFGYAQHPKAGWNTQHININFRALYL